MKIKVVLLIILFELINSCSVFRKNTFLDGKDIEYKVCSIDSASLQFYYHIKLLFKNRDTISVLSLKKNCNDSLNNIRIGQKYKFNLEMIYNFKIKIMPNGDTAMRNLIQDAYRNNNLPYYLQKPYTTKDLCGLHYIRDTLTARKKQ